jgi:hypothetical protein
MNRKLTEICDIKHDLGLTRGEICDMWFVLNIIDNCHFKILIINILYRVMLMHPHRN